MLVQDQVKEESMTIQEAAQRPQLPSDPNGWSRSGQCGNQQLFIFRYIHLEKNGGTLLLVKIT